MRYGLLTFLCLVAVIAYVQRLAISVPAGQIQQDLRIDERLMGLIMGSLYWAYALMQLPAGWLADRWGSKAALILYCVLWSVLTGCVGLASGFLGLLLIWTLMGAAQAGVFPSATKAIGGWFPASERAFAAGLIICAQAVGIALAPWLTARMLGQFTWQQTFAIYAIPGLVWAVTFALVIPSRRDTAPTVALPPIDWSKVIHSVPMQLLCAQQFLRGAAMVFFFTWFPRFLQKMGGLSEQEAGELTAWPGVGAMLGGLLGGVCSDWLLRQTGNRRLSRQGVAVAGMLLCAGLTLGAYFVDTPNEIVLLFSLGAFCGTFGGVSGYSVAIDFGGKRVATVFATMNMCGNIGAGLFPIVIGWIVVGDRNWEVITLIFAGLFFLDAICWALLNPKHTLFEEEPL
jgi:MFS family permease